MKIEGRKITLEPEERTAFAAIAKERGVSLEEIVRGLVAAGRVRENAEIAAIAERTVKASPRWAYVPIEKYVEVKKEMLKLGGREIRLPCFAPWQARWAVVVKGEIVAEWYSRLDENVCGVRIPNEPAGTAAA